jgi:hypothetical protein
MGIPASTVSVFDLHVLPNAGLRISRHFRQHVIIAFLDFLLPHLIAFFSQYGFRH